MKSSIVVLLACAILQYGCGSVKATLQGRSVHNRTPVDSQVNKDAAIALAKEDAAKTYGSVESYNLVSCEQPVFWRILLEPKNESVSQQGVEYLISKQNRWIVSRRQFPLSSASVSKEKLPVQRAIDKDAAVAIATKDALAVYRSLAPYDLVVCELTKVWVVVFSLKEGLDGGGPEYVIDKGTGQILDKKYYQ